MNERTIKRTAPRRAGFTLVEIMVAITIIAILAAIAVPAVMNVITQGRNTAMRMEISALDDAVQQYQQKYGSFPPDGSNWSVMQRHFRRAFPRMSEPDMTLLTNLTHPGGSSFSPVAMDRAEALVFFLGGFSSDEAHPLTGQGGPLEYVGDGSASQPITDLDYYQYNATRDNAFFEFQPERLPLARVGSRYVSADEGNFGTSDAAHGGTDLLPVYLVDGGTAPLVYFDSRSYGVVGSDSGTPIYNGYLLPGTPGGCRPYKTGFDHDLPPAGGSYGSVSAAFDAVKFKNPDSFQIISPGRDGIYGSINNTTGGLPVHFVAETGKAVYPNEDATTYEELQYMDIDGFQEVGVAGATENGQFDNVTNFSETTLENSLAE